MKYFLYKTFSKSTLLRNMISPFYNFGYPHIRQKIVILTIDVEPGYVEKETEKRVWEYQTTNKIGYIQGTINTLSLLAKYNIPATFFISNQCHDIHQHISFDNKHEIGLHLHIGKPAFKTTNYKLNKEIKNGLTLLRKIRNQKTFTSFRYGAWGKDKNEKTNNLLIKHSFTIDSSISPGCHSKRHDGEYDWRNYQPHLNREHIQVIPPTTINYLFKTLRADPCYPGLPEALINKYDFIVLSTHSSEMTYKDGTPTRNLTNLENFIKHCNSIKNVKFTTLEKLKNE